MAISEITDRSAILAAIQEFDTRGRDAFLKWSKFGRSVRYFIEHEGKLYDAKAIVGVAHGYQFPGEFLEHGNFSSGEKTVNRLLESLGFTVVEPKWTEEELVLVLHWYLGDRGRSWTRKDPEVRALSDLLRKLAGWRGMVKGALVRDSIGVQRQLSMFGRVDPEVKTKGKHELPVEHLDVWKRYADKPRARLRRVHEMMNELEAVPERRRPTPSRSEIIGASKLEEDAVNKDGAPGRSSKRSRKVRPRGSLVQPYQGSKRIARRKKGKPVWHDPEAYDRANDAHEQLRDAIAMHLMASGFTLHDWTDKGVAFDLVAVRGALHLVVEVKSLPPKRPKAQHSQLRYGLGQVLWYRQQFMLTDGQPYVPVLAVEREPEESVEWLATCESAGVVLTWPERFEGLVGRCRKVG